MTSFIAIVKIDNLDVLTARDWRDSLHGVDIRSLPQWRGRAEAELGNDCWLGLETMTKDSVSTVIDQWHWSRLVAAAGLRH
jgi:hypothetical protein